MNPENAGLSWYSRPELAAPWRIYTCPEHGRLLRRERFIRVGDLPDRAASVCGVCADPMLMGQVERCTCETDSARCPEHQNHGCGC